MPGQKPKMPHHPHLTRLQARPRLETPRRRPCPPNPPLPRPPPWYQIPRETAWPWRRKGRGRRWTGSWRLRQTLRMHATGPRSIVHCSTSYVPPLELRRWILRSPCCHPRQPPPNEPPCDVSAACLRQACTQGGQVRERGAPRDYSQMTGGQGHWIYTLHGKC